MPGLGWLLPFRNGPRLKAASRRDILLFHEVFLFEMTIATCRFWGPVLTLLLVGLSCSDAWAQTDAYGVVYRPEAADYRTLETDRFDYVYQEGAGEMVRRTARAFAESWAGTDSLVGPVDPDLHMPVVINDFNDRSNGFVQTFPFQQEIEAPSIKSPPLVARASSWPSVVAPHELVHAAHAEVEGGVGIGGLIRPFAPDLVRQVNLLAPRGLVEGGAVYRESHLEPGAGRLNAPLFQMKMKASMMSDDPWSLTQMLEPPAYTQPFNRYYIGGANAFRYLVERGDSVSADVFQTSVTWHNRLPFVGHGIWMSLSTGQFPHQIRNDMHSALRQTYRADLDRRRPFTEGTVVAGEEGLNHRRPYWIDDETLVSYVHGYDVRPGFYRIDAETGARENIRVQELTEDRVYHLGRDTSALYAGRYVQDPFVPRQEIAEVERIELADGSATRLTDEGRAFAPAQGTDGTLYAVTNDGPFTRWSVLTDQHTTTPLTPKAPRSIREIAPAPRTSTIAVLINEDGRQGIYRAEAPVESPVQPTPWIFMSDAVIYDLSWGPEGRYLLFSADLDGTPNVFAYDTDRDRIVQVTNVPFGALEPSLSPDRSTLAFVNYRHERFDLVRIPFRPDSATVVPDSLIRRGAAPPARSQPNTADVDTSSLDLSGARSYSAWRHLAPRMVYPTLHGEGDEEPFPFLEDPRSGPLGVGVGVGLQGADPLQRWAYRATPYWQDGRVWGEARLQSGAFLLRPSLSLYDRAFSTLVRDVQGQYFAAKAEERGATLRLRLPVTLRSNVYRSQLLMSVDTKIRQTRLYGDRISDLTDYRTRVTVQPEVVWGYRLQQNVRDVVPNTGLVLGVQGEIDAWSERGARGQGSITRLDVYVPTFRSVHTGVRLGVRALFQSQDAIFNTGTFVPRGHSSVQQLPSGPFLQFEAEVTQPLWYIDDGITLLPFYAKALSVYGFGETLGRVEDGRWREAISSVGGGVQLECRVFYGFDLNLRVGAAYRPDANEVVTIYR